VGERRPCGAKVKSRGLGCWSHRKTKYAVGRKPGRGGFVTAGRSPLDVEVSSDDSKKGNKFVFAALGTRAGEKEGPEGGEGNLEREQSGLEHSEDCAEEAGQEKNGEKNF